jgi:hypothetical protein
MGEMMGKKTLGPSPITGKSRTDRLSPSAVARISSAAFCNESWIGEPPSDLGCIEIDNLAKHKKTKLQ